MLAVGFALTGVVAGCAVTAQASPNMTVAVASGTVIVSGTEAAVSSGNVTITAADGSNPRFDLVCASSSGTKSAVAGTAAANPVFPDPAGKVVLASVYVPAADTTINSNQITDKRVLIKPWVQTADAPPAVTLVSVVESYVVVDTVGFVVADATTAPLTVTLPTPVGDEQRVITVKRVNPTNAVTVATAASTIDGQASVILAEQYSSLTAESDGATWHIIASVNTPSPAQDRAVLVTWAELEVPG